MEWGNEITWLLSIYCWCIWCLGIGFKALLFYVLILTPGFTFSHWFLESRSSERGRGRERSRGRETEKEKQGCERDMDWLPLHTPDWGWGSNPYACPWPGMEPAVWRSKPLSKAQSTFHSIETSIPDLKNWFYFSGSHFALTFKFFNLVRRYNFPHLNYFMLLVECPRNFLIKNSAF